MICRRKFFSFFGTGLAMLATPGLFVPDKAIKVATPEEIEALKQLKYEQDFQEAIKSGKYNFGPIFMLAG